MIRHRLLTSTDQIELAVSSMVDIRYDSTEMS